MRFALSAVASFIILASVSAQKNLPAVTLTNLDGQAVELSSLVGNGKITVISFWATWCSPCKKELDAIADIYEDWVKDYNAQLIAISIDDHRSVPKIKPMVAEKRWTYQVLLDTNKDLYNALNIANVPYTLLIDQNGQIVWLHSGYVPGGEEEIEEKIKALR